MDNGEMDDFIEKNNTKWKQKLDMIHDIASGMNYLHSQIPSIIHGDLKIQNVLIDKYFEAKVCDFGFSHWKDISQSLSEDIVRNEGTVTHVPPENWDNPHRKTETFDVYGFGILVWEAMTQKRPFCGVNKGEVIAYVSLGHRPDLSLIPSDVSHTVINLMTRCWSQKAADRPNFAGIEKELNDEINRDMKLDQTSIQLVKQIEIKKEKGRVAGMTWFENKIYVVCCRSNRIIVFSDQTPFHRLENEGIEIQEMKDPSDMTACKKSRSIFISDWEDNRCLWKIETNKQINKRWLDGQPNGLSSTSSDELLVVMRISRLHGFLSDRYCLDIYRSSDMSRLNRIFLQIETMVAYHAVQTSNKNFIILYKGDQSFYQVSEMSMDGKILRTCNLSSGESTVPNLSLPHLAIDEDDKIFITDFSGRVFLLNSELTDLQILPTKGQQKIERPTSLCHMRGRQLIVGEWRQLSSGDRCSCLSIFNLCSTTAKAKTKDLHMLALGSPPGGPPVGPPDGPVARQTGPENYY